MSENLNTFFSYLNAKFFLHFQLSQFRFPLLLPQWIFTVSEY